MTRPHTRTKARRIPFATVATALVFGAGTVILLSSIPSVSDAVKTAFGLASVEYSAVIAPVPTLDLRAYNEKTVFLAGYGTTTHDTGISATSTAWTATSSSIESPLHLWPVSTVYPRPGAILPFSRIVAYYGNFASKAMGILGELPEDEMLARLASTTDEWRRADPTTPVIPAIDYIAVTAQGSPGPDGKYRLRMPAKDIQRAIDMADQIHGLVFLDVQPGKSDLESELPLLAEYLKRPNVELAIDPEFSMKTGARPGTAIGTMDATDVNYAARFLAQIVDGNGIPPKILVVHRFTEAMVTGYSRIRPLPETEIVLSMDGWGPQKNKIKSYDDFVSAEPVQFAGIKLFYKNDLRAPSTGLLTPREVLDLRPAPIFVEYQ